MDSSSTVELLGVTDTYSFLNAPFFYSKDVFFWGGGLYILRTRDWKCQFLSKLSVLERTLMTTKRLTRRVVDSFHFLVSS